jgi:hypothetical protein
VNQHDPLQDNIRHTTALNALKQVRGIVDAETANDAYKSSALRWLAKVGWLFLLLIAALLARLLGVI